MRSTRERAVSATTRALVKRRRPGPRFCRAPLSRSERLLSRHVQGRNETKEKPGGHGNAESEEEHAQLELDGQELG